MPMEQYLQQNKPLNRAYLYVYFLEKFILVSSPRSNRRMFFLWAIITRLLATKLKDNNHTESVWIINFNTNGKIIAANSAPKETNLESKKTIRNPNKQIPAAIG